MGERIANGFRFGNSLRRVHADIDSGYDSPMRGNAKRTNRAARLRLLNKQYTYEEMASRMGGRANPAYLSQIANEVCQPPRKTPRGLSDDYATRIEQAFGLQDGWFDLPVTETGNAVSEARHAYRAGRADSVEVPVFDVTPSMGRGSMQPEHDTVLGQVQLSREWVRHNLSISSPAKLAMLTAYGDSMAPTFADGDMLLVDRGVGDVKLDAVYVLALNDELYVKRVQRRITDGAVIIKSDNPLYDPVILDNGERNALQVLGRVVWAWNGRKL